MFQFCTIVLNEAANGGGLGVDYNTSKGFVRSININATILSGNTATSSGAELFSGDIGSGKGFTGNITADYSACGTDYVTGNSAIFVDHDNGVSSSYADLLLGDLADNGGPTNTHSPLRHEGESVETTYWSPLVTRPLDITGTANHDIGAVEVYGASTLSVSIDATDTATFGNRFGLTL